jgi:FAD-dependent urate hydroxylase
MSQVGNDCQVTVLGAGPYGLSVGAYLRAAGIHTRSFGRAMSFWRHQMPKRMCLRSNWDASHIADPRGELSLNAFCRDTGARIAKPIPLDDFVSYGQWFQKKAIPDLDQREIEKIERSNGGFKITLSDAETFISKRVVVAAGIQPFAARPREFDQVPNSLASHTSCHEDLSRFSGRSVVVIGAGQSALESAALLKESGAEVEVLCRRASLRWVGRHPKLHHLGLVSRMLYSSRDVGPAGISRLVAVPHLFRRFPRWLQDRVAYRAIRPAVAGWLDARVANLSVSYNRQVVAANVLGGRVHLKLNDGSDRLIDHVLLATGYRVDVTRYRFLAPSLIGELKTFNGYPVLKRGLESSVPGLHFAGKPAAWSFGPIEGFVSGTEFASNELLRSLRHARNGLR